MSPYVLSLDAMCANKEIFDEVAYSTMKETHDTCLRIESVEKICTVGAGYVGGILSSIIAAKNPHIKVTAVDLNQALIDSWNSKHLPFSEAGLDDLIEQAQSASESCNGFGDHAETKKKNLYFTTEVTKTISESQVIFICVDTPVVQDPTTGEERPNLTNFDKAIKTIASNVRSDFVLVEKSTVPFGNAKRIHSSIQSIIQSRNLDINFEIVSIPEFFAEGTAIKNLLDPDRILIGADQTKSGAQAAELLAEVYSAWIPRSKILTGISAMSSELTKLAANAMLAQRISSINALSAACAYAQSDADVRDVSRAIGMDERIGPHMLQASIGYGGSCLSKDVNMLAHFYDNADMPEIGDYWRAIEKMNRLQKKRFVKMVVRCLKQQASVSQRLPSPDTKHLAVLGLSFKAGTKDTRNSPSIEIVQQLLEEGFVVHTFDRLVSPEEAKNVLVPHSSDQSERLIIHTDLLDACNDVDAVVVLTRDRFCEYGDENGELNGESNGEIRALKNYRRVMWSQVHKVMGQDSGLIIDGTTSLDARKLASLGFRVVDIGRAF